MLKRFIVENYSSFNKEVIFDLTAGKTEVNNSHVVDFGNVKILKTAIVYGANASGKSNLIKAIDFAKNIILEDIDNVETYKKHFRLNPKNNFLPSKFEFEIELNGIFYNYGFSIYLKEKKIKEEWLYKIGSTKEEMIFLRNENKIQLGNKLKLKSLQKRFEIYAEDMINQSHKLFLSEIAKKHLTLKTISDINDLFRWFDNKLKIIYPNSTFNLDLERDTRNIDLYKQYLQIFDTGIVDVEKIEEDFSELSKILPDDVRLKLEKKLKKGQVAKLNSSRGETFIVERNEDLTLKVRKLGLVHGNDKYKEVFDLIDESDGTLRLLDLIPFIHLFNKNYTILVDEFDRSLHPMLTKKFFELFYNLNESNTQLIITTHESTLLDLDLVRRDEIWFVEKIADGSSKIFSLEQFKERYDKKIEKAYLMGRYGAIPIFNDFTYSTKNV